MPFSFCVIDPKILSFIEGSGELDIRGRFGFDVYIKINDRIMVEVTGARA